MRQKNGSSLGYYYQRPSKGALAALTSNMNVLCLCPACDVSLLISLCPWVVEVMLVRWLVLDDSEWPCSPLQPLSFLGGGVRLSCDLRATFLYLRGFSLGGGLYLGKDHRSLSLFVYLSLSLTLYQSHLPFLFSLLGWFEGPWRVVTVLQSRDVSCTSRWQSTGEPPYLTDKD